jgi:hypothetical protein
MAHAEHTVNVQKPIAEVFAFLVDGLNDPKWRPTVTSITHVSGSGVGATQIELRERIAGSEMRRRSCRRPSRRIKHAVDELLTSDPN